MLCREWPILSIEQLHVGGGNILQVDKYRYGYLVFLGPFACLGHRESLCSRPLEDVNRLKPSLLIELTRDWLLSEELVLELDERLLIRNVTSSHFIVKLGEGVLLLYHA